MRKTTTSGNLDLRFIAAATALLFASSACTTNPYTGERQISRAAIGAVLGAGVGAAIGAATGDNGRERKKRALIGMGAGAIAGVGVGVYMDHQEGLLRERLGQSGVGIERVGDEIVLVMPANVTFETDRSDLLPSFFEVLSSVAVVLVEYDRTVVEVAGHTDATGTEQHNLELSSRRASTVATYLSSHGVIRERLLTLAFGEARPIASNATASGRQQNRRVEITLAPLTQS